MDTGNFFRVTCEFTVPNASNPCIMVWDYRVLSTDVPIVLSLNGSDIVDAFILRYYTPLAAQIASVVVMTGISIRAWEFPADGYDESGVIFTGTNANAMLPPANTLAIRLVRTNFLMRNGRKAFPGGNGIQITGSGGMAPATIAAFDAVTDAWATTDWVPEIDGVDAVFGDVIVRVPTAPDTDPTVFSSNITYGPVYWGTQNSRK